MIVAQMFKLARMPCFCKTDVVGSAFLNRGLVALIKTNKVK